MSLQSSLGNIKSKIGNDITGTITSVKAKLSSILGNVTTSITSVLDGGFVGIDEKNAGEIKNALERYIEEIEGVLASFNTVTNIGAALKGESAQAAEEFLSAIKELMNAYVTQMRQDARDFDEILANYQQGSSDIANQVKQNAEDIRSEAEAIRLD